MEIKEQRLIQLEQPVKQIKMYPEMQMKRFKKLIDKFVDENKYGAELVDDLIHKLCDAREQVYFREYKNMLIPITSDVVIRAVISLESPDLNWFLEYHKNDKSLFFDRIFIKYNSNRRQYEWKQIIRHKLD